MELQTKLNAAPNTLHCASQHRSPLFYPCFVIGMADNASQWWLYLEPDSRANCQRSAMPNSTNNMVRWSRKWIDSSRLMLALNHGLYWDQQWLDIQMKQLSSIESEMSHHVVRGKASRYPQSEHVLPPSLQIITSSCLKPSIVPSSAVWNKQRANNSVVCIVSEPCPSWCETHGINPGNDPASADL